MLKLRVSMLQLRPGTAKKNKYLLKKKKKPEHMHTHVEFYIQFICIFRVTDSRLRVPVWGHKSLLNPDINHARSTENKLKRKILKTSSDTPLN